MESIELNFVGAEAVAERHERADAAANRRLILKTAAALFEEHGVAAVTMAEIAAAAGVGKGTLYRRFDNKAELALALLDNQASEFQDDVLAHLRRFSEQNTPYLDQLDYFLDALVNFTDSNLPLLCVVQADGLVEERPQHSRPYHWHYQTISALLARAVAAGEVTSSPDVPYLADALLAPLRADLFRFQREIREFSLTRISSGLSDIVRALARTTPV
jgi:AcrR family transcriptional regulator